jgi:transcriptional regulator with XRE-family HTH domain
MAECSVNQLRTPEHQRLAQIIKRERTKRRYTQAHVASAIRQSRSWVAHVELGERRLDIVTFHALCETIDCDPYTIQKEIWPMRRGHKPALRTNAGHR